MPLANVNFARAALMPLLTLCLGLRSIQRSNQRTRVSSDTFILLKPRWNLNQNLANKRKYWGLSGSLFSLLMGLSQIFVAVIVFRWDISGISQTVLSPEVVRKVGEKSLALQDLNGKFCLLEKELKRIVTGKVSNCSHANSLWKISQDGLLLNSRCTLYKSSLEEVTIWGWPLQTAGLLTTGFSNRTFIILTGRVTEWSGGQVGCLIRKANTSWVQPK